MQSRNWVLLGIAVAIGLFAVLLANAWFSGVEQQQGGPAGEQKFTRIVVATQPLEFGGRLTSQNVRLQDWPAASVPQGAFNTIPDALKDNRVALRPIVPGEPVLASNVSGADGRATLAGLLPAGMRAVSVSVNAVSGVSGFVLPGSLVDVLLTREIESGTGGTAVHRSDVILESVQVLAIDQLANNKQSEPKVARTATLAVSLRDAQRLAMAEQAGRLSLVLRKPTDGDAVAAAAGTATVATVTTYELGGVRRAAPVQVGTAARPSGGSGSLMAPALPGFGGGAAPAPAWTGPTMTIVRGTSPTSYPVGQTKGG